MAKNSDPLIVFKLAGPLARGTRIAEGGLASASAKASGLKQSPKARKKRLRQAGVKTGKAPIVARVGREGAWFFYADRAPFKAYEHPGQVVVVDAKSGKVTKTRTLQWPPLIDGRLPEFMRTAAAYRNRKNYAFYRPYSTASSSAANPLAAASLAHSAATQQAADTLAAQHACAARISDTLGDFYDFGNIDSTRAQLGMLFEDLAALNPGVISERYSTYSNRTPTGFIQNLIQRRGCKQVLVYIAGGGIRTAQSAAAAPSTAVIGQSPHADGSFDAQYLSSRDIAKLVGQNRAVEFDVLLDAPYAGGFAGALQNQPNVALVLSPSGGQGPSFTFLPSILAGNGVEQNTGNPGGLLEFTNRLLVGANRFLSDPAETQTAAAQTQAGFFAWMFGRAFQNSTDVDFPGQLPAPVGVEPQIQGLTPTPPSQPPGPLNTAPVANGQAAATAEDTALPITLSGTDADGDALSFAVATQPGHGTLSGTAPNLTYTPNQDFNGADSFTFTASDGKATSAPATVAMAVTAVNDAPVLAGIEQAPAGYIDGAGAVAVTSALAVSDIDNDNLEGARVAIGAGHDPADDLQFTDQSGITGSFDSATGVLTLTGSASKAAYESALRSVAFHSTGAPSGDRTISFIVNDGATDSNAVTRTLAVDRAPTDIQLSNSAVDENQPAATSVGTLTTTDPDAGDSHSYSLVPGSGATDNSDFQISGDQLETVQPLDFEAGATRSVRIETDDGHGGIFDKVFTITVNNRNDAPTDISLSNASVDENRPSGTAVGDLSAADQDVSDSHSFSLVAGPGSGDNGSFQISGSTLETAQSFDFEAKSSYSIRVQADDSHGGTFEKAFTITVTNANDAPTDIALSTTSVPENQPAGTTVGAFSTSDQDTLDSHSYSLVAGSGSDDNGSFTIAGATLQTNASFNFEAKSSYSIRVQSDDGHGGTFEKVFLIAVTDQNDAPTDIALSNANFVEHAPTGTPVGQLSTTDEDAGDSPSYSLVTGPGDTDNGSFQLNGSTLEVAADLAQGSYSVRIRTDDGHGGTFEKAFTIDAVPPNAAPTDIQLSNSAVDENQPALTSVGTLTTTDPDAGDSHTYSLVSGTGSTDNGDFQISGDQLETVHPLDFEAGATRSARIETNDGHGGIFDKVFTISVNDTNDAPTDISLSPSSVAENQPSGTTVGSLSAADQDASDSHTFTLVSGTGSADNGSFTISGTQLKTAQSFDFETKASYAIRVQADDGHGGSIQKALTVTIADANDAPTDINLSNNSVAENQLPGVTVGTLSDSDQDAADTATYSLVSGTGSSDNGSFQITGTTLQTNASFDFETKASYSIRVQVKDSGNATVEKVFTINVTDTNDAPTNLSVSPASVAENQPSGTTVGTFSTTDQDAGDSFSYALVSGTGSDDNSQFQITGATLRTNASFDFETKASYSIRVRTTDSGNQSFEKQLTITITNANDAPTDVALDNANIDENRPSGSNVGNFSTSDQDSGDTFTYTLVAGTGSTDNAQFQITGNTLKSNASFNFEAKSSYSIRVRTTDSGGAFTEKQLTIQINNVNDPPVDGNESTSAVGNTLLEYGSVSSPSSEPKKVVSGNLLANTTDEDQPPQALSVSASDSTSALGGSVSVSPNGAFSYRPQAGDTGVDSFNYTVSDGQGGTDSSTVTIVVGTRVWYVKNNVAGAGTGTSSDPFKTLAAADTAANATGDTTYVFKGDGSSTNLTAGFSLQQNQKLLGESHDLVVGPDTLFSGTAANRPSLSGTVTLASGSTVQGVDVAGSGGTPIAGTNAGGSTVDDVNLSGGNGGVALTGAAAGTFAFTNLAITTTGGTAFLVNSTGTPTINVGSAGTESVSATGGSGVDVNSINGGSSIAFDSVSDSGGTLGINLNAIGTAGASFGTGSLSGSTADFRVNGGSGTVSYAGTLADGSGLSADIQNRSGGSITLSGSINDGSDAGGGINMALNTGGSTTFSGATKTLNTGASGGFVSTGSGHTIACTNGGLGITTTSGVGYNASGGGTLTVSGTGNTITTGSGTGLNVANTTISASGLTFQSISSNGAPSGIVLNNTGSSGGLTVTGTGSANSGGTIQNSTGNGIMLTTTHAASFARMNIQNSSGSGVRGTTAVNGFAFTNGTINNSGTGGGNQESSIAFNDPTGSATDAKVTGTVTITGNTLTSALWHGVSILQFAGTLDDVNISNNTITSGTTTGAGGNSFGSGIQLFAGGVASSVASVTRAELNNNTITNFPGGVPMALQGGTSNNSGPVGTFGNPTSATDDIEVQNNILNGGGTTPNGAGGVILPNQIVLAAVNGKGVGNFNIQNNGTVADPLSGSAGNIIDLSAGGAVTVKAVVSGNNIDAAGQTVSGTSGIAAGVGPFAVTGPVTLSSAKLYATVQNNTIKNSAGSGIRLNVNAGSPSLFATVTANTVGAPISATYGIQVVQGNNPGSTLTTDLQIQNNTSTGGTGGGNTFPGIGLRKLGTTTGEFSILNLTPSPASNAQTESFVAGQNPGSASGNFGTGGVAAVNGSSNNWTSVASIPTP